MTVFVLFGIFVSLTFVLVGMLIKVFFSILMYGRLWFWLRIELNDVSVVEDGGKDCVGYAGNNNSDRQDPGL